MSERRELTREEEGELALKRLRGELTGPWSIEEAVWHAREFIASNGRDNLVRLLAERYLALLDERDALAVRVETLETALRRLAEPVSRPRTEEGWLVQSEVMQIASAALTGLSVGPADDTAGGPEDEIQPRGGPVGFGRSVWGAP